MSIGRMKVPTSSEICADCSAAGPEWASINRGVLICDECCSVHRSLGRHISQVRHLRLAPWNSKLLATTQNLVNNGANVIWEHLLSDSSQSRSGIRKPNPKDPVHPIKSNFIKAKYQMLAFVHRLPSSDDRLSIVDLSKQLYSSVRTGNLETSLRLISLGAQPNYFHPDKGNTPLHVAAQAGQATQCELLVCHGADASAMDTSEETAAIVAIENGHKDLGFRLIETMYELTDRLTFYLCGRRPDHNSGINYLIPALQDRGIDASSIAKEARCKLQSLNNRLFEELCSDVYDEVDRRENDAVWLATQHHRKLVSDHTTVPFLPVNPSFSSTRNQGRQKLARFNALEFATVIVDILHDAKRREGCNTESQSAGVVEQLNGPTIINADHDYDDPEYNNEEDKEQNHSNDGKQEGPPVKIHDLQEQNQRFGQEVNLLRSMIQKLMQENAGLRAQVAQVMLERDELGQRLEMSGETMNAYDQPKQRVQIRQLDNSPAKGNDGYDIPKTHVSVSSSDRTDSSLDVLRSDNYDNFMPPVESKLSNPGDIAQGGIEYPDSSEESGAYRTEDDIELSTEARPSQEAIVMATEQITKKIQELLLAAQGGRNNRYIPCSSNISAAVNDMANLFPKHPSSESVRMALRLMITSAARLQVECRSSVLPDRNIDQAMLTQQVIQCAYDIAKAAKHLVTTYNSP